MNRGTKGVLRCFGILLVLGFCVACCLSGINRQAWAEDKIFEQNQGGYGGYQSAAYDANAIQPTADNWSRQSRFSVGNSPELKWEFNISSEILSSPVIGADGTIYFGARNGKLYAVDQNGNQKWSFETGYEIVSSAAIAAGGSIYVTSKDGRLYAFNPDGSVKWVYTSGDMIEASPVIGGDGSVYIGCMDGRLIAVNADGQDKWTFTTGGLDAAVAIAADGCIYAASRDGYLYCIKPDGSAKWECKLDATPGSPAVDKDNTIYVCAGKSLYAVNAKGQIKFTLNLNQAREKKCSPAIAADGCIYLGADMLYRFTPGSANDWTAGIYSCSGLLVEANGNILVASDYTSGVCYVVDQTGKKIWEYQVGGVEGTPALDQDGTIYLGSRDGRLYAIDTVDLKVVASDPANASKNVALDKSIKIDFNRNVTIADGYTRIQLYDELVNPVKFIKQLSGSSLVIDPDSNLQSNHKYTLKIPANAVKDSVGRNLEQDYTLNISTYAEQASENQCEFVIGQRLYKVLGETKGMDALPFIENGRSFVPVRYLAMALGVVEDRIEWDYSTQSADLKKDNVSIRLSVGSSAIIINGEPREIGIAPLNREGRIYLPARYVAEAFGYEVLWDQTRQAVYISLPGQLVR